MAMPRIPDEGSALCFLHAQSVSRDCAALNKLCAVRATRSDRGLEGVQRGSREFDLGHAYLNSSDVHTSNSSLSGCTFLDSILASNAGKPLSVLPHLYLKALGSSVDWKEGYGWQYLDRRPIETLRATQNEIACDDVLRYVLVRQSG
eukprot:8962613-Pyramimonas_sp.AAC.1